MRNACDSDSCCGLACDAESLAMPNPLAMWVERCEPLRPKGQRKSNEYTQTNLGIVPGLGRWQKIMFMCVCVCVWGHSLLRNVLVTPTPKYFSKSTAVQVGGRTAVQMGGVLQYKREAYCRVSLSSKLRSQESTAIQMGYAVLPYKLEVYCRTF